MVDSHRVYSHFLGEKEDSEYKIQWLYVDTGGVEVLQDVVATGFDETMFVKLREGVSLGGKAVDQLGIAHRFGTWPGGAPPALPFDPKYPTGGASGEPYQTIVEYRAALDTLPVTAPLRELLNDVRGEINSAGPLKDAHDVLAHKNPSVGARVIAAQLIQSVLEDSAHPLAGRIQSLVLAGLTLPTDSVVGDNDRKWWTEHGDLGWTLKVAYGLVWAATVERA